MAYLISVVNQKGGVGKTTTAVNLASYLALQGKFVLLVDLDPQANATSGLGLDRATLDKGIYEAIVGTADIKEVIRPTSIEGLKIAPATANLAGAGVELVEVERREYRLSDALETVRNNFDYVIIDCPPSLGLLTINGLTAADRLIIPVQAEYYALEGLGQLLGTIDLVRQNLHERLEIMGAVITMFDARNRLSADVLSELQKSFPNRVFRAIVPRNVRLAEAPSFGQPICQYDCYSKGAKAYEDLAREIIEIDSLS
jgi:chromosome partitioning protein